MTDLGEKLHDVVLDELTKVEFVNKKGRIVRTFKVGMLSVREVVKISKIAYSINLSEKQDLTTIHKAISTQSDKIISIIAIMLHGRSRLPITVIKYIIKHYSTPDDLVKLIGLVYDAMSVKSFMNSIILTGGMSLIKKEEIIASEKEEKA